MRRSLSQGKKPRNEDCYQLTNTMFEKIVDINKYIIIFLNKYRVIRVRGER